MVGTSALRALRLSILFLLFASTNLFAEPSSYECAPGTPKKGVGCTCPATHVARINGAGAATCEPKPAVKVYTPQPGGNYDQLVQQANDHADAYNCVKAEEVYQKALAVKPTGLEALVGSGNCLARQSKWTNAHARFDKALAVDRKYEPALWGKAEAYRLAYKKDDAIAAYKQYLVYYPGAIKAQQQLEKLGAGPAPVVNPTNRPGKYPSRTQDVWCAIGGTTITCNGVTVSGKPRYSDFEGIYGKPDRTWDTNNAVNKVHTWDKLGIVVYEPTDKSGKAISLTMPFKPMGMAYDPSTNFGGSVTVDNYALTGGTDLADVIKKPGVTQPYSTTSALYAKGDFNVFMTGRSGPLDLVELSLWQNDAAPPPVKYKTTQELKITVNSGSVSLNGVVITGKPKMADLERVYGKWDRVWDTGSSNRVFTWDKLGLVAYENRDAAGNLTGNCISTTFPFKSMGTPSNPVQYDPKTLFDGSIIVDGYPITRIRKITDIKTRPNAGQPYGKDSIVFDWGDVHVFTIAKTPDGPIDLVEVSYWNKDRGMSTKNNSKVARTEDVKVEVSQRGEVTIQGIAITGKPMVADFKKAYGEPDRVWEKKGGGGANRVHVWDSLGIIVYEPYNGRAISLTMPYKKMNTDFSPNTLFKGKVSLDGRGFYNFLNVNSIKSRPGATQPYGATSVVFDFGDVHVFTTAPQATDTIDLVEVSFWNKK